MSPDRLIDRRGFLKLLAAATGAGVLAAARPRTVESQMVTKPKNVPLVEQAREPVKVGKTPEAVTRAMITDVKSADQRVEGGVVGVDPSVTYSRVVKLLGRDPSKEGTITMSEEGGLITVPGELGIYPYAINQRPTRVDILDRDDEVVEQFILGLGGTGYEMRIDGGFRIRCGREAGNYKEEAWGVTAIMRGVEPRVRMAIQTAGCIGEEIRSVSVRGDVAGGIDWIEHNINFPEPTGAVTAWYEVGAGFDRKTWDLVGRCDQIARYPTIYEVWAGINLPKDNGMYIWEVTASKDEIPEPTVGPTSSPSPTTTVTVTREVTGTPTAVEATPTFTATPDVSLTPQAPTETPEVNPSPTEIPENCRILFPFVSRGH
ncbi:MAG: twin-arginine translocation signal domain-containing protein [Candidatus Shapirobacteria bacterium]|jgi:hypothetical protein